MTLKDVLLARPIDLKIYREERVGGLTALLYELPWSMTIMLLLILYWCCR